MRLIAILEGDDLHYLLNMGYQPKHVRDTVADGMGVDIIGGGFLFNAWEDIDDEKYCDPAGNFVLVLETTGDILLHNEAQNAIDYGDILGGHSVPRPLPSDDDASGG